jgi:uncharacterized membrane protein
MALMILGLVLFLGAHLVPAAPALRESLLRRLCDQRYKGAFALVSLAGFVLVVVGYRMAERGGQWFAPVPAAIAIAPYAVPVAFVLFAAANMRAHIRRVVQHPMLLGLLIWSLVHLFANGDARGTVLFGAFAAYAIVDLLSAVKRHAVKTFTPTLKHDAIAVVAGVALALLVMRYHGPLFGPTVVPFGA